MRLMNFFAPGENHGGQETFAWQICKGSYKTVHLQPESLNFMREPRFYMYHKNLPFCTVSSDWNHQRVNIRP